MDEANVEGLDNTLADSRQQTADSRQQTADADPWLNSDKAAQEIKAKQEPVDYSQIVGDARLLFLGENHSNYPIRHHLTSHARALREAGITHYAIEANEQGNEVFDRLNRGEPVDLSRVDVGPGRADYEQTIRAMVAQGIKVVAVDIDQSTKPTKEEREARMTANLQRILDESPDAKVAYLVGAFHTSRKTGYDGFDMTGKRIADAGIKAVVVRYAGGEDDVPRNLTGAVQKAGLANSEFALKMSNYAKSSSVPYGTGEVDYAIHLPQQASSRPTSFGRFRGT